MTDKVKTFLTQGINESVTLEDARNSMKLLFYV
jgi:hypothetical protein